MQTLEEQLAHYKAVKERIKKAALPKPKPAPLTVFEPAPVVIEPVTLEVTTDQEAVDRPETVTKTTLFRHLVILREVATKHLLSRDEIKGPSRSQRCVKARNECCFRLKYELGMSLPRIGLMLGDRDHSTILHAVRSYESQMDQLLLETIKMNAPAMNVQISTRVEQYVALRDKIKFLEAEQKETLKPYQDTLEKLGNVILAHLNETGANSVSTDAGNAHITPRKSATVSDMNAFFEYVKSNNAWDLMDRKANVTTVSEFVEEHGAAPPGVNYSVEMRIGIRRK